MLPNKHGFCILLALISAHLAAGKWLKMYEEEYHRPTYYNRAHSSSKHVDYNRKLMEAREVVQPKIWEFNVTRHKSFYVNLLYKTSVICAGALYTRRMIITSSRCFLPIDKDPSYEFKAKFMSVMPANNFEKQNVEPFPVKAFFLPSTKRKHGDMHGIALVALAKKLPREHYPYIHLMHHVPKVGSKVLMSYLDSYSRDLKFFRSKVVDLDRCKRAYEGIGKTDIPFNKNVFCVKNTRKTACSSRPGDPLIVDNQLAGINIYGEQCDELAGHELLDVYYSARRAIPFLQYATDLLRGLTLTRTFSINATARRRKLHPKTKPTITEPTIVPTIGPTTKTISEESEEETATPAEEHSGKPSEGPSTVPSEGQSTVPSKGQSTAKPEGQSTAPSKGQSTAKPEGQSTAKPEGQSTAKLEGQSTAKPDGQSTAKPDGQSTAKPEGQSKAPPEGQSTAKPDGQSTAKPDGQSTAKPEGQSTAKLEGQSTAKPDGQSKAPPEGQSTAKPDGQSTAKPEGQSTAPPEGQTTAKPEGQSTAKPEGQSTAPPEGQTTVAAGDGATATTQPA